MDYGLLAGMSLGVIGSLALNIGKGVQKMKVHVLKHGLKAISKENRKDFFVWLFGVSLAIVATVAFSLALKFTDKSSIVASLSGIGLIGLVLFSAIILKEPVGFKEIVGSLFIIMGTGLFSYFNHRVSIDGGLNSTDLLYTLLFVFIGFIFLTIIGVKFRRLHGVSFGIIAGSFIGIAMILGDIALVKSGGSILGQFKTVYVYLALFCGNMAFAITQYALYHGNAILVVPIINSFIIISSMIVEFFVFRSTFVTIQYLGIVLLITGVFVITTSRKQLL